jgi:N-acetylglutamate synthase-like GNAT family acetyltransferase
MPMTEAMSPMIRLARLEDTDALANLAGQLGYPSTVEQIRRRFEVLMEKSDENAVFVAEANGKILGWVHVHLYSLLVDDPETEIGGLVVDEAARGQRIGEELMQAAEAWTLEKGCSSVYLRSNVIRTRAHEFYKRIGYSVIKSQYAFRKKLEEQSTNLR